MSQLAANEYFNKTPSLKDRVQRKLQQSKNDASQCKSNDQTSNNTSCLTQAKTSQINPQELEQKR